MGKALLSLVGGAALGAGAMYFLDPKLGSKRRSQATHAAYDAKKKLEKASHAVSDRAAGVLESSKQLLGMAASTRSRLWSPRTRALLATVGLGLAAAAGARFQQ